MKYPSMISKVILFASILISFFSCSSQNDALNMDTIKGNGPLREITLTAISDPSAPILHTSQVYTRTTLGSDKHTVEWLKGEELSIFAAQNTDAQTFTCLNGGTRAKIVGQLSTDAPAFGLYPSDAKAKYAGGWAATTFPAEQTAEDDNMPQQANMAIATMQGGTDKSALQFQNVCALLKINFNLAPTLGDKKIGKIVMYAGPDSSGRYLTNISGNIRIYMENGKFKRINSFNDTTSLPYVSLAKKEGYMTPGTDYYMCIPAMKYENGFELHFVTTDGEEVAIKRFKGEKLLENNKIYPISTTLKSMKSAILHNVPLINIANANSMKKFVQEPDGTVQLYKANNLTVLKSITGLDAGNQSYNLTSLDELPYYSNVNSIRMPSVTELAGDVDFSKNKKLTLVYLGSSKMTSADFHGLNFGTNPQDDKIYLFKNMQLTHVNVANAYIKNISITDSPIKTIDVSTLPMLEMLTLTRSGIETLNLSQNINLIKIDVKNTKLTELDLTHQNKLTTFHANFATLLSKVDLGSTSALEDVNISNTALSNFDVTLHRGLKSLDCAGAAKLTSLNLENNTNLTTLFCYNCHLTTLDVSKNTQISNLNCSHNQLKTLDISKLSLLTQSDHIKVGNQTSGNMTLLLTQAQRNVLNTVLPENRNITPQIVP